MGFPLKEGEEFLHRIEHEAYLILCPEASDLARGGQEQKNHATIHERPTKEAAQFGSTYYSPVSYLAYFRLPG